LTRPHSGYGCQPDRPARDRESLNDKTFLRLYALRPDSHEFGLARTSWKLILGSGIVFRRDDRSEKINVHPG